MSQKSFIVYYKKSDVDIRCYNKEIGIKTYSNIPFDKYNCFEFIKYEEHHNDKSYELDDDELKKFYNNLFY